PRRQHPVPLFQRQEVRLALLAVEVQNPDGTLAGEGLRAALGGRPIRARAASEAEPRPRPLPPPAPNHLRIDAGKGLPRPEARVLAGGPAAALASFAGAGALLAHLVNRMDTPAEGGEGERRFEDRLWRPLAVRRTI